MEEIVFLPGWGGIIDPGLITVYYVSVKAMYAFKVQRDKRILPEMPERNGIRRWLIDCGDEEHDGVGRKIFDTGWYIYMLDESVCLGLDPMLGI